MFFVGSNVLVDGGQGDKDGVVNGVIDDPSTFGAITLNAEWNQVVKEILLVEDPEQLLIPEIPGIPPELEPAPRLIEQKTYYDNILRFLKIYH